ncbi:MAG TPA: MarR family transcriptional regulator [Pyrinomonadaceae bacterium]|nr:MarR family transcriptional regulator [Pyrinomonadaceae bacterium]
MLSKHTVWLAAQKPPCYNVSMGEVLTRRIKQKADFESPAQEAMLNLLVAGDYIHRRLERVCARFGLTRPQYNVLRMLRGAHPQGHPRGEIASRMLTRSPDVTRLVDRLEEQGLVERDRVREDRRLSITRVTEKGLRLLEEMQPYIAEEQRRFANTVSRSDCIELSRICESIYEDEENPPPA